VSANDGPYYLEFTEEMKGWFGFGNPSYEDGFTQGKREGSSIMFHLTISMDDVYRFIRDKDHFAKAEGWVGSDVLGGRLPVVRGDFNLFVDEGGPRTKHMLYRLFFADGNGDPLTLSGYKDVRPNSLTQVWPETSTLYTRVLRGHVDRDGEDQAEPVGSGIIHILVPDFARQVTTFRVRGGNLQGRIRAGAAFGKLFFSQLWEVFGPRL
jgi:cholesterol oxidase